MFKTLGSVPSGLIVAAAVAGASALVSVAVLNWRASASEAQVERHETRLGVAERNQVSLDMHVRILRQDSSWSQRKLDALLRANDVPVPDKPPLPDSCLEERP